MTEPNGHSENAPPDFEVVARLSPEELQQVRLADNILQQHEFKWRLLIAGNKSLWGMLGRKYALPADVILSPEDGVLFRRVATSPPVEMPGEPEPAEVGAAAPVPSPPVNRAQRRRDRKRK